MDLMQVDVTFFEQNLVIDLILLLFDDELDDFVLMNKLSDNSNYKNRLEIPTCDEISTLHYLELKLRTNIDLNFTICRNFLHLIFFTLLITFICHTIAVSSEPNCKLKISVVCLKDI